MAQQNVSDEINIRLTMSTQRWIGPKGEVVELPVGIVPEGYEPFSGYMAVISPEPRPFSGQFSVREDVDLDHDF